MTSERQLKANRRNAKQSTGPRTVAGKQAVRLNAVKHGILSREVLLPEEDEQALVAVTEQLHGALCPVGEWERVLVDRIVEAVWRLRRLGRVETGLFSDARYERAARKADE